MAIKGATEGLGVEMLEKTEKWKDWFGPPTKRTKENNKNISIWTTIFPNLLKLTEREKQLNENVMITYKRPQTIATLLTNYKKLAHEVNNEEGISFPCGKCLLCKYTMVKKTSLVKMKNSKRIKLKK